MSKSPNKPTKDSKAPIKPIMTMEEFHRTLGPALVDNLNRNMDVSVPKVKARSKTSGVKVN